MAQPSPKWEHPCDTSVELLLSAALIYSPPSAYHVDEWLSMLKPCDNREKTVVILRVLFGWDQTAVAEWTGGAISRTMVYHLEQRAVRKMRMNTNHPFR